MPRDRAGTAFNMGEQQRAPVDAVRPSSSEQTIFASLPAGRLNWAVGSVHGESEQLASLHDNLAQHIKPGDNLIYLGNFLGRGADVGGTVQELLLFRRAFMAGQIDSDGGEIVYLRGSQEEIWHKLLQIQFAPNPRQVFEWMLSQGVGATLEAYGGSIEEGRTSAALGSVSLSQWTNRLRAKIRAFDGHDRLMSALRRAAFTEDGHLLLVNAGIDPSLPLSQQSDSFWWRDRHFDDISGTYENFTRVIRGFDPQHSGLVVRDATASIDGGCGFGGSLIAACFDPVGNLIQTIEA